MNEIEDAMVGQTDSKAVVVMFSSDKHFGSDEWALTQAQAAWLRDRIDEELALLDGGRVAPDTLTTDEIDVDGHPPDEMMGSPKDHTQQDEDDGGDSDDDQDEADAEESFSEADGDECTCPDCGEEFKSERGVNIHRTKAHGNDADGDEDHECPTCGEGFDSPVGMKVHHSREHDVTVDERSDDDPRNGGANPADTEYSCPVCGERFGNPGLMRSHRDDDHDETEVVRAYREQVREDLPRNVSIADVEQSVAAHGTLYEVQQDLRVVPRDELKLMIGKLQLTDALEEHSEIQAIHMIEDLHDELGLDEPVPEVPAADGGASA